MGLFVSLAPEISTHILKDKVLIVISTRLSSKNDIKVVKHSDHVLVYVPIIKKKT